jgi:hypothetical protein
VHEASSMRLKVGLAAVLQVCRYVTIRGEGWRCGEAIVGIKRVVGVAAGCEIYLTLPTAVSSAHHTGLKDSKTSRIPPTNNLHHTISSTMSSELSSAPVKTVQLEGKVIAITGANRGIYTIYSSTLYLILGKSTNTGYHKHTNL